VPGRFVTERSAAETRLLAAVVASVSDAVVTTDEESAVVYMNAAAEALFGVRCEDVVGDSAIEAFVHPGDRSRARACMAQLVDGGSLPAGLYARLQRADGSVFDGELGLFAVRDSDGAMLGLAGVVRDITRQRAEQADAATLRAVLEAAAEAIIGIDIHGVVLQFSPSAERLYGYRAEEVVGRDVSLLLASERRPRLGALLAHLASGEPVRRDSLARRKDGSHLEVEFRARPMVDIAGVVRGAAITILDISERRRTQRLLDRIVEHSPAVISVKDLNGRYRLFNPSGAAAIGLDASQLLGRTDGELFDKEIAQAFVEGDRQVIECGEPMTFENQLGGRYFVSTKFPIRGVADAIVGIGIVAADVTELRRAESDRARLAALVQAAPDAIIAQDREGRIATWNPGAEAMFGIPAEEAIGRDFAETIVPSCERERFVIDREAVRAGQTITKRVSHMRGDGSVFPARVSSAPVAMIDGLWSGTLCMIRDITDMAAAEAELAARATQLERSNADLERFAYAASHDLQEPLQSIKLSAGAVIEAASERLDDDERELLAHIDAAASRLSGQIRGLMEVARVALGGGPEERAPVEVAVQDALDALRAAAQRAKAQIDVHRPLPDALVPRTELSLVLQNLIANGIKYHRRDVPPRVTVSGSISENHVEVRVADNGVGLNAIDRARVFGIFERADSDVPGTGMGLATAQRMIERHGGSISVASAGPGRGSEFTIWLPLRS
jgi:PAS domain S-box-containing protein